MVLDWCGKRDAIQIFRVTMIKKHIMKSKLLIQLYSAFDIFQKVVCLLLFCFFFLVFCFFFRMVLYAKEVNLQSFVKT